MPKTLKAKHDKIVLKSCEEDDTRLGGIFIPDTGKEKSNLYEVIDVGPGRVNEFTAEMPRIPMECKIGDIVFLKKAVVDTVTIDGVDYGTCREVEIQGVVVEVGE